MATVDWERELATMPANQPSAIIGEDGALVTPEEAQAQQPYHLIAAKSVVEAIAVSVQTKHPSRTNGIVQGCIIASFRVGSRFVGVDQVGKTGRAKHRRSRPAPSQHQGGSGLRQGRHSPTRGCIVQDSNGETTAHGRHSTTPCERERIGKLKSSGHPPWRSSTARRCMPPEKPLNASVRRFGNTSKRAYLTFARTCRRNRSQGSHLNFNNTAAHSRAFTHQTTLQSYGSYQ